MSATDQEADMAAIKVPRRAGYPLNDWLVAAGGFSRSAYYEFPEEIKPHAVRVGAKVIVTESPNEWLERVGKLQNKRAAA